jgi:hypothetical protein
MDSINLEIFEMWRQKQLGSNGHPKNETPGRAYVSMQQIPIPNKMALAFVIYVKTASDSKKDDWWHNPKQRTQKPA